jgi:ABC-type nitrate/sulfonate/bicarbonate transport system permease component
MISARTLAPVFCFTAVVAAWLIVGWFGWINPLFFPTLPAVTKAAKELIQDNVLGPHFGMTAYRTGIGFGLAAAIGIPVGIVFGLGKGVYRVLSPLVDFLRSVPGTALFPLFLLVFGIGDEAKIANAVFAAGLIILVNTVYGVQNVSELRLEAARTMGANRKKIYMDVVLPAALPAVVGGLRIAASISLIVIVVAEMFVGTPLGLGRLIFRSYELFDIPKMYVGILTAGCFGYALNRLLVLIEERWIHWSGK